MSNIVAGFLCSLFFFGTEREKRNSFMSLRKSEFCKTRSDR